LGPQDDGRDNGGDRMTAVVQAVTVPAALVPNQIGGHGRIG